MEIVNFLYHHIDSHATGSKYSISPAAFERHVKCLVKVTGKPSSLIDQIPLISNEKYYTFTFDDGYCSHLNFAAPILEKYGCRGHFFIITGNIGNTGYLNEDEILELHQRGHRIGSHGHSHDPLKNSSTEEWGQSISILSDILKQKIKMASVPGGWYSKKVVEAVEKAGIEWLFTSEPTIKIYKEGSCNVLGRFSISGYFKDEKLMSIWDGKSLVREREMFLWETKKLAKKALGGSYLKLREWYFTGTKK